MSIQQKRVKKESAPALLDSHIQAIPYTEGWTAVNVNRAACEERICPCSLDSHIQAIPYTEG